jgi:protein-tyrosine phosphatase
MSPANTAAASTARGGRSPSLASGQGRDLHHAPASRPAPAPAQRQVIAAAGCDAAQRLLPGRNALRIRSDGSGQISQSGATQAMSQPMSDRIKPFDGVRNFRDFGDYPTVDGARVRKGVLFRSAHFAEATPADAAALDALGIDLVLDLRRPAERLWSPNIWPGGSSDARVVASDAGDDSAHAPHLAFLQHGELTRDSVDAFMLETYQRIPFEQRHIDLFRAWFRALAQAQTTAVIHCAAGKDRTGLLCALTLHLLGAPDDVIMADYLLTNHAVDIEKRLPERVAQMSAALGRQLDPVAMRPMMGVDARFLHHSIAAIDQAYGSREGYAQDALGLTSSDIKSLRAHYRAA